MLRALTDVFRIKRLRTLDLFGVANLAADGNDVWARHEFRDPPSDPDGSLDGQVTLRAVITNRDSTHGQSTLRRKSIIRG